MFCRTTIKTSPLGHESNEHCNDEEENISEGVSIVNK